MLGIKEHKSQHYKITENKATFTENQRGEKRNPNSQTHHKQTQIHRHITHAVGLTDPNSQTHHKPRRRSARSASPRHRHAEIGKPKPPPRRDRNPKPPPPRRRFQPQTEAQARFVLRSFHQSTTTPAFPTETEAQPVSCFSRKRREHRDLRSCFNRKRREHREKRENRIKREKISVRNELQKKLENLYLVAPCFFNRV